MNNLKVTFTIPDSMIQGIRERMALMSDLPDIVRDELDKLTTEDYGSFMNEVIPQIVQLIKDDYYKEEYMKMYENSQVTPKNGRGKHVHRGRHAKKGNKHA